jgi:hypothetical protein
MPEITCPACKGTGKLEYDPDGPNPLADVNQDGQIDVLDLGEIRRPKNWNKNLHKVTQVIPQTLRSNSRLNNKHIKPSNPSDLLVRTVGPTKKIGIRECILDGGDYGFFSTFDHSPCGNEDWEFTDVEIKNQTNKGVWLGCYDLKMYGCVIGNTMSHSYRPWWLQNALHDNCTFGPALNVNRAALKLHCAAQSGHRHSANIGFDNCNFIGWGNWIATVGPQDQYKYELVRSVRFKNCIFDFNNRAQLGLRISAQDILVENCRAINMPQNSHFIEVTKWGSNCPDPVGCIVRGCTASNGNLIKNKWYDTEVS